MIPQTILLLSLKYSVLIVLLVLGLGTDNLIFIGGARRRFPAWMFFFFRDASVSFFHVLYKAYNSIYPGPGYFLRAKEGPVLFFFFLSQNVFPLPPPPPTHTHTHIPLLPYKNQMVPPLTIFQIEGREVKYRTTPTQPAVRENILSRLSSKSHNVRKLTWHVSSAKI